MESPCVTGLSRRPALLATTETVCLVFHKTLDARSQGASIGERPVPLGRGTDSGSLLCASQLNLKPGSGLKCLRIVLLARGDQPTLGWDSSKAFSLSPVTRNDFRRGESPRAVAAQTSSFCASLVPGPSTNMRLLNLRDVQKTAGPLGRLLTPDKWMNRCKKESIRVSIQPELAAVESYTCDIYAVQHLLRLPRGSEVP